MRCDDFVKSFRVVFYYCCSWFIVECVLVVWFGGALKSTNVFVASIRRHDYVEEL